MLNLQSLLYCLLNQVHRHCATFLFASPIHADNYQSTWLHERRCQLALCPSLCTRLRYHFGHRLVVGQDIPARRLHHWLHADLHSRLYHSTCQRLRWCQVLWYLPLRWWCQPVHLYLHYLDRE
jgi:hypothetical protein